MENTTDWEKLWEPVGDACSFSEHMCMHTLHTVWLKSVLFSFLHDICSRAGIIKALLYSQKEGCRYWPRTSTSVSFCCRARAYDPTAHTRRLEGKSCNFQCGLSVIIRCWPFLLSQYGHRQMNKNYLCRKRRCTNWTAASESSDHVKENSFNRLLVPETQNILLKFWFIIFFWQK